MKKHCAIVSCFESLLTRVVRMAVATLLFVIALGSVGFADQQTVSVSYGLGMWNRDRPIGHLASKEYYDFAVIAYGYEKSVSSKLNLTVEPYLGVVKRPQAGLDIGATVNAKYYFNSSVRDGFYVLMGGGAVYTTIGFKDQGTHGLFVAQGGVGYRWKSLFFEGRFRHYSNASFAHPNRSVNAATIGIGYSF